MKLLKISIIALSAGILLSSCNQKKTEPEKQITLIMAEVNPPDSISGKMDQAFKEKVEELSNGNIKIDLNYSGILGDESQIMKMILTPESSVHLARVSASLASYGGEKSRLITLPFTFNNEDHFWKFANSDVAEEILVEPYEKGLGVRGLFYGEEGFRHFFSTKEIKTVEDMKGKNVRVSSAKILHDLMNALQANPVTVPFTDLYSSMQRGQTDVADQPISNYLSNSFHKVAPYMIFDGHMLGAIQVVINSATWDSLSEKQQKILKEAGRYASNYCRTVADEADEKSIEQLKAEGAKFTEVKDNTPWQEAVKNVIAEASKDFPELYKKIKELDK